MKDKMQEVIDKFKSIKVSDEEGYSWNELYEIRETLSEILGLYNTFVYDQWQRDHLNLSNYLMKFIEKYRLAYGFEAGAELTDYYRSFVKVMTEISDMDERLSYQKLLELQSYRPKTPKELSKKRFSESVVHGYGHSKFDQTQKKKAIKLMQLYIDTDKRVLLKKCIRPRGKAYIIQPKDKLYTAKFVGEDIHENTWYFEALEIVHSSNILPAKAETTGKWAKAVAKEFPEWVL